MNYAEMKVERRQSRHVVQVEKFKRFMSTRSREVRERAMLVKGYKLHRRKSVLAHQDWQLNNV